MPKPKREAAPRPGGGGRLSRSEVTTVRLDPKLRFAAEVASRSERRTVSSLIETALAGYLANLDVVTSAAPKGQPLLQLIEHVWDPDEPERFVKFAQSCSWLLNTEEDRCWKYIQRVLGVDGPLTPKQTDLLRQHYETFLKAARGELPESTIMKLRIQTSRG
jgi:hypothetical protein